MIICENCEKEHDGSYGSGRFCSSKCARGFSTKFNREETNKKVSKTLKDKHNPHCLVFFNICTFCNKLFSSSNRRKTCSNECLTNKKRSEKTKKDKKKYYFKDLIEFQVKENKQKYFYLYKITNKINGKYYIGVHQTKNLNDGYVGSGKILPREYSKFGIENFEKEVLEYFESKEEMYLREAEIVNEEFLKLEETYNLRIGGDGGWDHIHKDPLRSEKFSIAGKKSYENPNRKSVKNRAFISNLETGQIKYVNKDELEYYLDNGWVNGKPKFYKDISDEEIIEAVNTTFSMVEAANKLKIDFSFFKRKAISLDVYKPNKGRKGSIKDKCWIYNSNLEINKFISKDDLNIFLSNGWILGRKYIYS